MTPIGVREGVTWCGEITLVLLGFWCISTRQTVSWLCVPDFRPALASIDPQTVLSRSCGGKGPSAPREHSPAQGYQSHQRRTGAGMGRTGLASSSPRMTVPPFPHCLCSSPSSQPGSFHQNRDEVLKWWGRAAAPLDSTLLVAPLQKAPTPSLWDSLLAQVLPLGLSIPWQKHPAPTFSISFLEKPN